MRLQKTVGIFVVLFALLLSACGAAELPAPETLFAEIRQRVELPEFIQLPADYLEDYTGIGPDSYESAVYCLRAEGLSPDEIAIIRAKDSAAAAEIEARLNTRLERKEAEAQGYLTEYLPVIREGVVRRDGLTVSLIVSDQVSEIEAVYARYN